MCLYATFFPGGVPTAHHHEHDRGGTDQHAVFRSAGAAVRGRGADPRVGHADPAGGAQVLARHHSAHGGHLRWYVRRPPGVAGQARHTSAGGHARPPHGLHR